MREMREMREYYYDTWTEDGTTPTGYRETGWFTPTHIERRKFAMIEPGAVIPALVLGPITRTDIVKYAGASWDFNPFHHDELFAKRARSGEIIAHGMLIMAYLGRSATAYLGTVEFNKFTARFKSVTRTGDTLRIEGRIKELMPLERGGVVVLSLTASSQRGETVAEGEVTATVPE